MLVLSVCIGVGIAAVICHLLITKKDVKAKVASVEAAVVTDVVTPTEPTVVTPPSTPTPPTV